jgi:hypothetical protein
MDLVKLNRLLRPAVRLVKGMEVKQAGGIFEFSMLCVVSWFKVRSHNAPRLCTTREIVLPWSRSELRGAWNPTLRRGATSVYLLQEEPWLQ